MTHTEVDLHERAALLHALNVDIASKIDPSEIDKHASSYASKLDQQASEGDISDEQYRDGFEVIARIVSWSAAELKNTDNTTILAELDPDTNRRHADIDATTQDFLSTFRGAELELDESDKLIKASYVQQRKDQSLYFVNINRNVTEQSQVQYCLSVQELNDENAFELLNGLAPGSKKVFDALLRREFIDDVPPETIGKIVTGLAMG